MKKIVAVLLAVIMIFIFEGCYSMNVKLNERKISEDCIEYLSNKYDSEFETESARLIVDPANGSVVNVVCKDKTFGRPFRVFHFMDSSSLTIEDDENELNKELEKFNGAEIKDEYGKVVIGCRYEDILKNEINEDIFILCQMEFDDYFPSREDIDSDIYTCLNSVADYAYPKIFVFYNEDSIDKDALIKKVQQSVSNYHLHMQYVFLCSVEIIDEKNILSNYGDNWNNYEDFIVDEENTVKKIDGFYCTAKDGASDLQVIKE